MNRLDPQLILGILFMIVGATAIAPQLGNLAPLNQIHLHMEFTYGNQTTQVQNNADCAPKADQARNLK